MALTVSIDEIVQFSRNPLLAIRPYWKRVRLRDVASVLNGFAFKSSQFTKGEGMPLIRIRDVRSDTTEANYVGPFDERYIVEPGDLLIGMDGDFNCARWRGQRGLLNQRVCKVALNSDQYHPRFLDYALPGYLNAINYATSSVTVKHLSSKTVEDIPLPFPPLHEQEEIVAEIEKHFSRLDEAVANLKRVKANLKRYKAAVLKTAVEGRLVPTEAELARRDGRSYETGDQLLRRILETRRSQWKGKGKYKEPTAPNTTDLPELPAGWVWASIDQLGDVGTGATPLRSRRDYYESGKIPWVTSGALNEEFVSGADEYITEIAVEETNAKVFPAHTLLVAMYGEGKTRGKVSELLIDAATNQACAAIVMEGHSQRVREFTKLFFLKNYEDIRRLSSGGVQPNLNLTHIKATAIPFPPLTEQQRIVAEVDRRLSILSEVEAQVDANLHRAQALRQLTLASVFSSAPLRETIAETEENLT